MDAAERVDRAESALRRSDAFAVENGAFAVTTTELDAQVTVSGGKDGPPVYRVTVIAPTIDSVVADESVAGVVADGWADTFERRLVDPHQVGRGLEPIEPIVAVEEEAVTVRMRFRDADPERGGENARALAEFVEGVWVQGLIPGYTYREPAKTLLDRAVDRSEPPADGSGVGP